MQADVSMGDSGRATLERSQVAVWLGRSIGAWTVRIVGGGILGGRWQRNGSDANVSPGWIAGATLARTWLAADGWRPFLRSSFALAGSGHGLSDGSSLLAFDLRAGGDVGWRLPGGFELFAVARAFGGPIFWSRPGLAQDTGTDRWHIQLGAGAAWTPPVAWSVRPSFFAEGVPLGERGISAGVGFGF